MCFFHNHMNARDLYDKYKENFYYPDMNEIAGEKYALKIVNEMLLLPGYLLCDCNLPSMEVSNDSSINDEVSNDEKFDAVNHVDLKMNSLTEAQRIVFNTVINAVNGTATDKCIFIDGPGGTGKSYLLNLLISYFPKHIINVLAVAWIE